MESACGKRILNASHLSWPDVEFYFATGNRNHEARYKFRQSAGIILTHYSDTRCIIDDVSCLRAFHVSPCFIHEHLNIKRLNNASCELCRKLIRIILSFQYNLLHKAGGKTLLGHTELNNLFDWK